MSEAVKHFDDENFNDVISKEGVVLVDFYADWCGPCRTMTPIIHEFADEMNDQIVVGKLDIDASQKTTQQFAVSSIPTLIVFKNGEEVERAVGVVDLDGLKTMVQAHVG